MPSFAPVLFSKRVLPVPHPKGLLSFLQGDYGVYSTAPALAILWENRYYRRSLLFQDKFSGAVPPLPTIHLKSPDCYGASSAGVRTILLRIRNPEIVFAPWASSAVRISMTNYREAAECILLKGCSSDWVVTEYADRIPMEQYLPEKSGFSRRALCAARMPVLWSHIRIREKKRTAVLVKEAATLGTSDRPTMILDYANSRPQIIILALRATSYRAVRSLSKTFALTWRLAMTASTFVGPSDSLDAIVKSWACLSCISITPLAQTALQSGILFGLWTWPIHLRALRQPTEDDQMSALQAKTRSPYHVHIYYQTRGLAEMTTHDCHRFWCFALRLHNPGWSTPIL